MNLFFSGVAMREKCRMETQFGVIHIENGKLVVEIDRSHFNDLAILAEWLRYLADLISDECFDKFDEIVIKPIE